ncbi:MAG: chromosome partitioning protein ParB [Bacillales bacterium]|nr:chromosome partitioning protein ParB [Bacillales bacterium]
MAKGLGKGFGALFPEIEKYNDEQVQEIFINELRPNPYQPRKTFDENAIDELRISIEKHGILQPIIARKSIRGYEIVVGERRFRAAKLAGLEKVPVVVRSLSDEQMMEHGLLENLQREDLNPIEEAQAYQTLMKKLDITQDELSKRVGKSRSHIANHVRLLILPQKVLTGLVDGKITMGHGRTILGLKDKKYIEPVYDKIVRENLNVRQVEQLVNDLNTNVPRETKKPKIEKSFFIKEQENTLREKFGTLVNIKSSKDKGKIEIEFYSDDDLQRLLDILGEK